MSLQSTVINNGMCIGCGMCASANPKTYSIALSDSGMYTAVSSGEQADDKAAVVCPFGDGVPDEDQIAKELYPAATGYTQGIGYYADCYAGHVSVPGIRDAGSSGGMGTWVLVELLNSGEIDGVLHVSGADDRDGVPFAYTISKTEQEIRARAKSRYYPVEMSKVLQQLRQLGGRYAVVGLPCFIKGLRLLASQDAQIGDRVAFTVALFCGHLKSSRFADFFAWQAGIKPGQLESVNFRTKLPDRPASNYGITVKGADIDHCRSNLEYSGSSWGYGFFKYTACDYCDDVVGETADISVGDAWLSEYVDDSRGSNVVVVRNEVIRRLVDAGVTRGELALASVDPDVVVQSQEAGLRHRREGLSYRLFQRDKRALWRPQKRVAAKADHLTPRQHRIFELREAIAAQSHTAFKTAIGEGSLQKFFDLMKPLLEQYDALYRPNAFVRFKTYGRKQLSRIKQWLLSRAKDRRSLDE
ncbi:Coenzyme F420 hydrogenase/dehydrogenase, beta subunit C-terminal domain [Rhodopirellula bahusiensis]|uniref:Coenzyme F420 hydrogenase n=1 Tax=Rhodopirellula bahusiensis TaxID=2014065 RepID=A0A2G1WCJ0_9BACT|nr:Coenzyme F420 hydrogenase/dehydrogenase, beta subunit C-terminal domain [Rhodopirellula bahusiensis]PHQ36753.1 coenzyme F420 hydrogenase [Rhodopirellula bahusiensis]